jgi:hypothetical protein
MSDPRQPPHEYRQGRELFGMKARNPDANTPRERVYRLDLERLPTLQGVELISESAQEMTTKVIPIVIVDVEFAGRLSPLETDDVTSPREPLFDSPGLGRIPARASNNTGSTLAAEKNLWLQVHRASLPFRTFILRTFIS